MSKHKHRWQFVRKYKDAYTRACLRKLKTGNYYPKDKNKRAKVIFEDSKEKAEFICECGKVKIVEVKR